MVRISTNKLGPNQQKLLTDWFQSSLGQLLVEQERHCLEQRLPNLFGYYLIQIGTIDPKLDLLRSSPAKSKLLLDSGLQDLSLWADPLHLPLATDSVDGVLMHHTLDFSVDPHQMLREVERILIPEGKLLIVGFNPWSLWGGWRMLNLRSRMPPWSGHFFPVRRVSDWLSLLGFDLLGVDYVNFRPPLQSQGLMRKLIFMEGLGERVWPLLGGVYVLEAVKRTLTMTPIKPRWRIREKVLPAAVEPTTRNMQ
ncbi:MAG: class I SAM-dependent methyltransferase [Pseudomonadota bacterium]